MPFERSLPSDFDAPLEPICRNLRSKSMFVAGMLEPPADMQQTGSGHCWCNLTQHVMGPDSQFVERQACNSARPCYEATL